MKSLLSLLFFISIPVAGLSQISDKITLDRQDITIGQLVDEIQRQSNYSFFYKDNEINSNDKVSVKVSEMTVGEVLAEAFRGKNISFTVQGKQIILARKENPAPSQDSRRSLRVKGVVTTPSGEPLSGVTVIVAGKTSGGAVTDRDGWYSITVPDGDSRLEFNLPGYEKRLVAVGNRTMMNISMEEVVQELEKIVVVGYGQQKKVTVTGAIATVNVQNIKTPVANLSNVLQGKVAGIISVQSSGEPGYDNSTFTIRGISSFTGNTSPLIIVDGVQRDDINSDYAGSYNNIDPEDIAGISLLKDASATAVYGAKGANGVLIITTKRGSTGKARVSLKFETGLVGFTKTPEMLDGVSYMTLYNEARRNSGSSEVYSRGDILKTASGLDPYLYPNVNWIDEVYRDFSSVTNANINVTGGSQSVRYYMSASFYDQEGLYNVTRQNGYNPNLSFRRYDFRSNVDADLSSTTLFQLNISGILVDARYPGITSGDLWYLSYATSPVAFPVKYPDGKWAGPFANAGNNPMNEVQNNGYIDMFRPTIQSVFTLGQKLDFITEGLSAYGRFSFDSYGEFRNKRYGRVDLWNSTGRDGDGELILTRVQEGSEVLGYERESSGERIMYLEGNVTYDRTFGGHSLSGMVLYNMRSRRISTAGDAVTYIPYRNQAIAGRISYGYKDKYLFEVNASYTGSENFEAGSRFGLFPAVSAGWVVSNEKFFGRAAKTVDLLKIRASYGVVGNDQIGSKDYGTGRFGYLTQVGAGGIYGFGSSGTIVSSVRETVLGVEGLTWEKSYKTNIGLELGLFRKMSLTFDVFMEKRKNILIERSSMPYFTGFDAKIFANMGEMDNKGFDANIEYNDKFGQVGLRFFGNVSYSNNKIVFQDEPVRRYAYQSGTGTKFGEFYGLIAEGYFTDQAQIDASPTQFGTEIQPGDIKYKDLNGDGVIDDYDKTYLGKSWFPDWSYGTGFTVSYWNFDLSLFFQGVSGVGIMANGTDIESGAGVPGVGIVPFSGAGQYPNNTMSILLDRWTEENPNPDAYYPRLRVNENTTSNNYKNSTHWLKNGDYIRLKQASLGYTLSTSKMRDAGISYLYFYLSGQNLLTFSKFKLWDPELGPNAAKYPITRMITLGVRVQF